MSSRAFTERVPHGHSLLMLDKILYNIWDASARENVKIFATKFHKTPLRRGILLTLTVISAKITI